MITLQTLEQATAQEVFEQAAIHLLTQNEKCKGLIKSGKEICVYKNDKNQKCAAGCFISGEEYMREFEANSWLDLVKEFNITPKHQVLIGELQNIHDTKIVEEWEEYLYNLGNEFSLNIDFLKTFKN
jgi:hypothetical protein